MSAMSKSTVKLSWTIKGPANAPRWIRLGFCQNLFASAPTSKHVSGVLFNATCRSLAETRLLTQGATSHTVFTKATAPILENGAVFIQS